GGGRDRVVGSVARRGDRGAAEGGRGRGECASAAERGGGDGSGAGQHRDADAGASGGAGSAPVADPGGAAGGAGGAPMSRAAKAWIVASAGLVLGGCAGGRPQETGIRIGDETLKQFEAGVTTEAWLLAILG